jgi:hypothetical protein
VVALDVAAVAGGHKAREGHLLHFSINNTEKGGRNILKKGGKRTVRS